MKVTKHSITVRDLIKDYSDKQEAGVTGYGGKLNIRPPYQREFIYKPEQQVAVISSILAGMPLSIMYWAVNEDGTYEILDGQQRTMSICRFLNGSFAVKGNSTVKPLFFENLPKADQDKILNYELDIYFCDGDMNEKIQWFEIINIAGEKLTKQELRNAIFTGPWVIDAKRYFSRTNCAGQNVSDGLVKASTTRQELLELAIEWASNGRVEEYMASHRFDEDARSLWEHFTEVINWVKRTFVVSRPRLMQSIDWGKLYYEFGSKELNPIELESRIKELLVDEDVTNPKGVYQYLLSGEEKYLSIRAFPESVKNRVYTIQKGVCVHCKGSFKIGEMDADHITPWSKGGTTSESNCQMLCIPCNRSKGSK